MRRCKAVQAQCAFHKMLGKTPDATKQIVCTANRNSVSGGVSEAKDNGVAC